MNNQPPSSIMLFLYEPPSAYLFPIEILAGYLRDTLKPRLVGEQVNVRKDFFQTYMLGSDELKSRKYAAELIAPSRIHDISTRDNPIPPSENRRVINIAMEMALLDGIAPDRARDFLYQGPKLMAACRNFVPESERDTEHIHIIFTDRLFCTWDDSDARYHARAVMLGFPNLVSMPGLVEAPARPREYYIKRHLYAASGLNLDGLEAEFAGKYLLYRDARSAEVLKGYCLQAIFNCLFSEPFCTDPDCRLFNAHWQSELLHAQIQSGRLCEHHSRMLKEWLGD